MTVKLSLKNVKHHPVSFDQALFVALKISVSELLYSKTPQSGEEDVCAFLMKTFGSISNNPTLVLNEDIKHNTQNPLSAVAPT